MDESSSSPSAASNAELFAALWGVYILVHELKQAPWIEGTDTALMAVRVCNVALALAIICAPRQAIWLAAVSVTHIVSVGIELPAMSNCWLFGGLLSLGIAGSYLLLACREGCWTMSTSMFYARLAPTLRWSMIVLYGFAALAKYNVDFLDVNHSCAAYFLELFAQSAGVDNVGSLAGKLAIVSTLVVETALPILFCIAAGRRYAILLGLAFHTFLAHNHNLSVYDFNAMLAALYVTFLPPDYVASLQETPSTVWAFRIARHRWLIFPALVAVSLLIIWAVSGTNYERSVLWRYRICLWLVAGLVMTIIAALTLFGRNRINTELQRPFRWPTLAGWLAIILISLNGAAPYLGYKTAVTYTMFSNLRTEAGLENHLFVPAWARIGHYQDDLIKIENATIGYLEYLAQQKEMLVLHDLRMISSEHPEESVTYEMNGIRRQVPRIGDDPLLSTPPRYWERKLLYFRTIPTNGKRCQW